VKTAPIVAARIEFAAAQAPRAPDFGDVYHPREGAPAQAREVFLAGNGLPARWQGRARFTILETGFGLGGNFLAAWAAWRDDPRRCERLHFVSFEKHPPTRADLARALATSPWPELARELLAAWPPLVPNLHALRFDAGRVQLLLGLGDATVLARALVARVDAFFLDGFAPARNAAMWSADLFRALARSAAPGATAATWSAARIVRDGLAAAGFAVQTAAGPVRKRDITLARYAPRFVPPRPPGRVLPETAPSHALVIGAGLAGAAVARALALHGVARPGNCPSPARLGSPRRDLPRHGRRRRHALHALAPRCQSRGDALVARVRQPRRCRRPAATEPAARSRRDAGVARSAAPAARVRAGAVGAAGIGARRHRARAPGLVLRARRLGRSGRARAQHARTIRRAVARPGPGAVDRTPR
jgi:tRNA 5-methylaminomethyl-2-thiouridine biosynthesis bifunctional protein